MSGHTSMPAHSQPQTAAAAAPASQVSSEVPAAPASTCNPANSTHRTPAAAHGSTEQAGGQRLSVLERAAAAAAAAAAAQGTQSKAGKAGSDKRRRGRASGGHR